MRRTYTLFYMTPLLVAMNFASCQNRPTGSIQTKEAKNSSFVTDSAQSEKSIKMRLKQKSINISKNS